MSPIRSWLYVPGDRPDRMAKAAGLRADARPDAVILDLEDAVAPSAKATARSAVAEQLAAWPADGPEAWVRINGTPAWWAEDLAVVVPAGPAGIVLPKATTHAVGTVARLLDEVGAPDLPIVALVESAQGLLDAPALARHPRVRSLALGEVDLAGDLGLVADPAAMNPLRLQVVVAAAAAGGPAPTGPVFTQVRDLNALADSTAELRSLGFGARAAVHPDQVPIINAEFTPTAEELQAARRVVALYDAALERGDGVVVDDAGRMVDEAVVRRARRLLELNGT